MCKKQFTSPAQLKEHLAGRQHQARFDVRAAPPLTSCLSCTRCLTVVLAGGERPLKRRQRDPNRERERRKGEGQRKGEGREGEGQRKGEQRERNEGEVKEEEDTLKQ